MSLPTIWFILIGVLLTGYAVLDGFDLGIGSLYPFLAKTVEEKETLLAAVGPVWGANEVWLLTGGGALFAAFPPVYATVFSGFYLAMMLVLFALIFRAAAVEYRSLVTDPAGMRRWDLLFGLGSFLPALLFGVAMGNVYLGLPLDRAGNYIGGFFHLLNPYALLLGLTGLAAFLLQGSTFALLKTGGEMRERARVLARRSWGVLLALYLLATLASIIFLPARLDNFLKNPALFLLPVVTIIALLAVVPAGLRRSSAAAFLGSSAAIGGMVFTFFAGLYPDLVPATTGVSLTVLNASSAPLTLRTMLLIAAVGVPIVLFYTAYIYRLFRGEARPGVGY